MKSTDSIVYLIEDDEGSRASTECLLGVYGFSTKSFASAEQFLSEVVETPVGCIVSDLVLPGMSGVELFQRTRGMGWRTPVIILTAFGEVSTAVHALKNGIYDFLEKPFPPERLIQSVTECIQSDKMQ